MKTRRSPLKLNSTEMMLSKSRLMREAEIENHNRRWFRTIPSSSRIYDVINELSISEQRYLIVLYGYPFYPRDSDARREATFDTILLETQTTSSRRPCR